METTGLADCRSIYPVTRSKTLPVSRLCCFSTKDVLSFPVRMNRGLTSILREATQMKHLSIFRLLSAVLVCLATASCQSPRISSESDPAVRGELEAWVAAFNECNADKAAALYAPDALLWGTVSQALISTPAGIHQYFERACAASTPPKVVLGEQVIRVQGPTAVSSGTYAFTLSIQGQQRSVPARFSFAYRKAGQGWLIVSHNSSLMPAAPQPLPTPGR